MTAKERGKLEFAFWEAYQIARREEESTSAAAYAAILTLHEFRALGIRLEEKSIEEIIVIVRKIGKDKIAKALRELRKAARTYKGKNTGPKTFLGHLRRQALTELKHISNFTYMSELYEETDRGESVFSLSPPHSQLQPNDIDIYDRETLGILLRTRPLPRRPRTPGNGGMKPLL